MKTIILALHPEIETKNFTERLVELGVFCSPAGVEVVNLIDRHKIVVPEVYRVNAEKSANKIESLIGQTNFILVPLDPFLLEVLGERKISCNAVLLGEIGLFEKILKAMVEDVAHKYFHDVFEIEEPNLLPELVKTVREGKDPFLYVESETAKLYHDTICLLTFCPYERFFKNEIFKIEKELKEGREERAILRRKAEILEDGAREYLLSDFIKERKDFLNMRALVDYIGRVKERI